MFEDDITRAAWIIAAKHIARGQKDPTHMIAEGIRSERERWTSLQTKTDDQQASRPS